MLESCVKNVNMGFEEKFTYGPRILETTFFLAMYAWIIVGIREANVLKDSKLTKLRNKTKKTKTT